MVIVGASVVVVDEVETGSTTMVIPVVVVTVEVMSL